MGYSWGGDIGDWECTPGAARLCDLMVMDDGCTGIQLCGAEGSGWEACLCPSAVAQVESALAVRVPAPRTPAVLGVPNPSTNQLNLRVRM